MARRYSLIVATPRQFFLSFNILHKVYVKRVDKYNVCLNLHLNDGLKAKRVKIVEARTHGQREIIKYRKLGLGCN